MYVRIAPLKADFCDRLRGGLLATFAADACGRNWPIASFRGNAANGHFRRDCVAKLKNEGVEKFGNLPVEKDFRQ
jgi:hypothetical protein